MNGNSEQYYKEGIFSKKRVCLKQTSGAKIRLTLLWQRVRHAKLLLVEHDNTLGYLKGVVGVVLHYRVGADAYLCTD